MDVSFDNDVTKTFVYVSKRCSRRGLWAMVNNAGFNVVGNVEFLGPELYQKAMDVNFYGAVRVTRTFLHFVRRCEGKYLHF